MTAPAARRNPGGRPPIGPQVNIAIPPDMLARVDAAADVLGVSRSEWIRQACADRLPRMLRLTDTSTGETATVPHDHESIAAALAAWFPGEELAGEIDALAAELLRYGPPRNAPGQVSTPVAGADLGGPLGIEWSWV